MFNHALQRLTRPSRSDRNPRVPRSSSNSFHPGVRSIPAVFMLSLLLVSGGCLLIPEGRKVNSGHEYSKEAIAFLDSRGVTRAETIANLGLPSWESTSSRVLLYVWHSSEKWLFLPADNDLGIHKSVAEAKEERWVLLIAYDQQGLVSGHALRRIGKGTLEEACSEWSPAR